jgi:hypothetical protein
MMTMLWLRAILYVVLMSCFQVCSQNLASHRQPSKQCQQRQPGVSALHCSAFPVVSLPVSLNPFVD